MMTRKDYEAIAVVLDANHAAIGIVADMADLLEEDNPRFDLLVSESLVFY